jgi:hypothetical protein
MQRIGFSTGAIALGDFRTALTLLAAADTSAVELSALRVSELCPLLDALDQLDLRPYKYISFHAPSRFSSTEEEDLIGALAPVVQRRWPIILHPDSIHDQKTWLPLQRSLCFENMDKRKPIGRTADELSRLFDRFPDASLCFDLGHAHQFDRTMTEARQIAQRFAGRIRQLHVSEVNTASEHVPISAASEMAFAKVLDLIDPSVPVIIESVVRGPAIAKELERVTRLFEVNGAAVLMTD